MIRRAYSHFTIWFVKSQIFFLNLHTLILGNYGQLFQTEHQGKNLGESQVVYSSFKDLMIRNPVAGLHVILL